MDKKDDNKKPSKDKKKDKGKKDKKKKVVKKKSDDKISQSQIVNIKIGDLSKPRTRTRRAPPPKVAPPPQIQRQLQYLPSLAGQAPMIPPPLVPAPAPAPRPPPPPAPPPPVAEPRRTGDFFSDTSKSSEFGSSYDLGSATATLDDFISVERSASRPSMSRAFNRPRSDSTVSAMTDPTYADLDFDNFSDFNASAPSRFGSSYDLASMASEPPPIISEQLGALTNFEDIAQPTTAQTEDLGSVSISSSITTNSTPNIILLRSNVRSGQILPIEAEKIPPVQELQPTQTPIEAPAIEAQLVLQPDIVPQDLVLSSERLATERPVAEPILGMLPEPMISEPIQEQAVKGDVKPEDEATGGGVQPLDFYEALKDPEKENLMFNKFTRERKLGKLPGGVTSVEAYIAKYKIINTKGRPISEKTFGEKYNEWVTRPERLRELEAMPDEELVEIEVMKKAAKKGSSAAAE